MSDSEIFDNKPYVNVFLSEKRFFPIFDAFEWTLVSRADPIASYHRRRSSPTNATLRIPR